MACFASVSSLAIISPAIKSTSRNGEVERLPDEFSFAITVTSMSAAPNCSVHPHV